MTAVEKYKDYSLIHQWIRYHYGKANKCESPECRGKSSLYTWALIKGKQYAKERKNFMMLCRSCHAKYDVTEEFRKKMAIIMVKNLKGTNTPEFYKALGKRLRGKPMHSEEFKDSVSLPINQLTLEGKFVRSWRSAMEAERAGFHGGNISNCCNGLRNHHKNYKWEFATALTQLAKD